MASTMYQDNYSIGPQLHDKHDFTLNFEQLLFTILPAAVVVFLAPFYVWHITRKPPCIRVSFLFWLKTVGLPNPKWPYCAQNLTSPLLGCFPMPPGSRTRCTWSVRKLASSKYRYSYCSVSTSLRGSPAYYSSCGISAPFFLAVVGNSQRLLVCHRYV